VAKNEGDEVKQGEALVELETEKVNVEVSAEQGGVLQKILKQEGDVVTVGDVLGLIGEGAEVPTGIRPETPASQQSALPVADGQRPVSPLARRIASEYNIDLSQVKSHSPHGRVTKDDVISYIEKASGQQAPGLSTVTALSPQTDSSTSATPAIETPAREAPPVPNDASAPHSA